MITAQGARGIRNFFIALMLAALTGCASVDPEYAHPDDPFEGFNRAVYKFNDGLDKAIIKPLAKGYNYIMPGPANTGVTNFFSNLDDVGSAINNLLQGKIDRAVSDVMRVAVNTTFGMLGFIDMATPMNLPKYGEDFDQTLGVWGMGTGPYIVIPVLGPSSGRGIVGIVADYYTDPVTYVEGWEAKWALRITRVVDTRAGLLQAEKILDEAALDPYAFVRDAYLQKRHSDVYDGDPPEEDEFIE